MTAMRLAGFMVLGLGLPAAAFPPLPKPKENTAAAKELAKALRGSWEVTRFERGGTRKVGNPPGYALRMTIDGVKLTQTTTLEGRDLRPIPSTFVVDARNNPVRFELKYKIGQAREVTLKGVLTIKGDQMIWAFAPADGTVPTKLDGKLIPTQSRFTLTRVKK